MAAIRVSLASSLTLIASTSSSSSSSLVFTKLRSSPVLGVTFSIIPSSFCYRRGKRMAHSIARATLGLTYPAQIDDLKISFAAKESDFAEWKGDILAVGVLEKDMAKDENSKFQNSILKKLDSQLGGLLSETSSEEDFTGKVGQSTILRIPGLGSKRVGLVGVGQGLPASYRSFGEAVASAAKASQANNVAIALASSEGLSAESKLSTASAIATGTMMGTFEDNRFRSESKKPALKSVDILGLGTGPELEQKLKYAEEVCTGVIFGRELVNAPANVLTPGVLAEEAKKIAALYSDVLSAKILDAEQCKELKMGSYLGVAAASANPPHFIHLCYKPPSGPVKTKLALVGKGLTFDSGGYNIKTGPGSSIELMKFDMGGSAAVLGAAKALGQIKPAGVEVHFIVAACENMISGTGMRPGDIITASNGKTIEPEDSLNSWGKRRDLCASVITNYCPMILCTQQGVKSQLEYLQQCLPGYDKFGISRKGSEDTSDEHCTIFYDKEKVELLEGGTFWLSESPSVPGSMSWGCEVPCIATWATFQLKGVEPPGFSFQIVNTNMDELSPRARRRSALLTWQHIASLPPSLPVIYCGGFNTQKESTTGRFLLGRSREHGVVGDMRDAWPNARVRKNVSLIHTYHGFKGNKRGALEFLKLIFRAFCLCWDRQTQDLHVDWILFRGRALIPVSSEVVSDNIDGYYPSSHYPIFAEFLLPRSVRLLEAPAQDVN